MNLSLQNAIFRGLSELQKKAVVKWRNDLKQGKKCDEKAIDQLLNSNQSPGKNESKRLRKN